jgi:hypothetical protein
MERHHQESRGGQSPSRREGAASDARRLTILRRYVTGEISARQAAKEIGPDASEHDVFDGLIAARLPLPSPPPDDVAREVAALRALYGPTVRGCAAEGGRS